MFRCFRGIFTQSIKPRKLPKFILIATLPLVTNNKDFEKLDCGTQLFLCGTGYGAAHATLVDVLYDKAINSSANYKPSDLITNIILGKETFPPGASKSDAEEIRIAINGLFESSDINELDRLFMESIRKHGDRKLAWFEVADNIIRMKHVKMMEKTYDMYRECLLKG